jgi:aspartate aminotransferase-like enzyme
VQEVGALMVRDTLASGSAQVDLVASGFDALIPAPPKGWSAAASAGLVMVSERAGARLAGTQTQSFAHDLKKGRAI